MVGVATNGRLPRFLKGRRLKGTAAMTGFLPPQGAGLHAHRVTAALANGAMKPTTGVHIASIPRRRSSAAPWHRPTNSGCVQMHRGASFLASVK